MGGMDGRGMVGMACIDFFEKTKINKTVEFIKKYFFWAPFREGAKPKEIYSLYPAIL
jgi:hypothetical protein